MVERRFGRIVTLISAASLAGRCGNPERSALATALQGMTKVLALEGGRSGITANLLAVSWDDGAAPQPLRLANGGDVAQAVTFLCADDTDFITGSTLVVDGGLTMR